MPLAGMSSAYLQRPVVGFHRQHGNSEKNRCAAAVHGHSEKASLSWVTLPECRIVLTPVVSWSRLCRAIGGARGAGRDLHGWELCGQIWISWTPHWKEPFPLPRTGPRGDRWSMTLFTVQRSLCRSRLLKKREPRSMHCSNGFSVFDHQLVWIRYSVPISTFRKHVFLCTHDQRWGLESLDSSRTRVPIMLDSDSSPTHLDSDSDSTRDMRTRTRLGLGPRDSDRTRQTAQLKIRFKFTLR